MWQGHAAAAFARRVGELPKHLADGESSMAAACTALSDWAEQLVGFQQRAAAYEQQAADAAASVASAQRAAAAIVQPDADASPEHIADVKAQAAHAQGRVQAASGELAAIIDQARRLLDTHDATAQQVASVLRHASDVAPAKPGFFERLGQAFADACDFVMSLPGKAWDWIKQNADLIAAIGDVLSDISTVLGIVALVCLFIPPLEVASGVLFAVSAGLAGGALLAHGVAKAAGADVSWGTIALDAVGVLTWGAGKVAATGMRNAADMYKAGAAVHAATGFESGAEVIGAANFLRYARIAKGSLIAGAVGLEVGAWNPWFGNVYHDAKTAWNKVFGAAPDKKTLGATFISSVNSGRREATAPA